MNPETKARLTTVTPLSRYLAMALFIAMPFLGVYIGYTFAPEKVVYAEQVVETVVEPPVEKNVYRNPKSQDFNIVDVADWPGEYPVMSDGNDLLILQEMSGLYYLSSSGQYDLGLQRIESVYYTDDFRYEDGYLKNSDVVIRISTNGAYFVEDADPESFELIENDENAIGFARDNSSLFYVGWYKVFSLGVNPDDVEFELITDKYDYNYSIVKEADRVWVPRGCAGVSYIPIDYDTYADWTGPCE